MHYFNINSKRINPFWELYRSKNFTNAEPVDFPYLVDIEVSNHCNLKCIFCGQQTMQRKKGYMKMDILQRIVKECTIRNTPIRMIRWGEPFLHPRVIKFIEYIKENNLPLHITTNGLAFKEHYLEDLVNLELDSIIFSFQGATKEQYELMRNNHRYEELKQNILKLIELRGNHEKPFIHISSTMTNETPSVINQFVQEWINKVDSVGIGKTHLSRLSISQIKSFENIKKLNYLQQQETIEKEYLPCTEVHQKLSVDWDGKVSCCCWDWDNFLTVGDVNKQSLYDIWNHSEDLKTFRKLIDAKKFNSLTLCSTCYHTYKEFS